MITFKKVGYLAMWNSSYGFVHTLSEDGTVSKYFTHVSDVWCGTPVRGCIVRFEVKDAPRGPKAVRVEYYQNGKELDAALMADMLTDALGGAQ